MIERVRRASLLTPLLALMTIACGGGQPQAEAPGASTVQNASPVDPATAGSISGQIRFEGQPPAAQPISMATDPNCQPGTVTSTESVLVGNNGALQNVYVHVKDGLGDLQFPVPATAVVLDQQGCRYLPHVVGVRVGQPLEVDNSDATLHNIHAVPTINRDFNIAQPAKGMKMTHTFTTSEVMVPFTCDVHPWMKAWVGVSDHPFFTVTGADGSFTLTGLPPGTYTIEAWHETLGTQTQTVTVAAKAAATTSFTFKS
ncbi:MAG: carboxypeptidase regulatory-like domain-containing protein [Vicinamibacterales bacterium]